MAIPIRGRAASIINSVAKTNPQKAEEMSQNYVSNIEDAAEAYADRMSQIAPASSRLRTDKEFAKQLYKNQVQFAELRGQGNWADVKSKRDSGNPFYQYSEPLIYKDLGGKHRLQWQVDERFNLGGANPFSLIDAQGYIQPKKGDLYNGIRFGMGVGQDVGNPFSLINNTPGGALWAAGYDPNDPNLGYRLWDFSRNAVGRWDPASNRSIAPTAPDFQGRLSNYIYSNGLTLNNPTNLANAVNYYYSDLAARKDRPKEGFFDSMFGKMLTSVGIGALTGGVGSWLGPAAGGITGATLGGLTGGPIGAITGGLGGGGITNNLISSGLRGSGLANFIPKFITPSTNLGYSIGGAGKDAAQSVVGGLLSSQPYYTPSGSIGVGWPTPNPAGLPIFQKKGP